MLRKISQTQKDKYYKSSLMFGIKRESTGRRQRETERTHESRWQTIREERNNKGRMRSRNFQSTSYACMTMPSGTFYCELINSLKTHYVLM